MNLHTTRNNTHTPCGSRNDGSVFANGGYGHHIAACELIKYRDDSVYSRYLVRPIYPAINSWMRAAINPCMLMFREWTYASKKVEDKTAIPAASYGLPDDLFGARAMYLHMTEHLRKLDPSQHPTIHNALVQWSQKDQLAMEEYNDLSVHPQHWPIEKSSN